MFIHVDYFNILIYFYENMLVLSPDLQDDSPRGSTVSLQPSPVTVHIDHLVVERNDDGSFHIRGTLIT